MWMSFWGWFAMFKLMYDAQYPWTLVRIPQPKRWTCILRGIHSRAGRHIIRDKIYYLILSDWTDTELV